MAAEARPVIEIQGLKKAFGGRPVLRGVDLEVPEGKTVVVLGLSGSGKSTLLKHIIGLLKPDEGRILLEGQDIATAAPKELEAIRWRFGMVFQNAALLQSLSVGDNVALPLVERRRMMHRSQRREAAEEISDEAIRARVSEKLTLVGLAGAEEKMPSELSGGMRKRYDGARPDHRESRRRSEHKNAR
ncbi:MAG: ABC transporter ATP-binding protein [Planctomycetota bacterium]